MFTHYAATMRHTLPTFALTALLGFTLLAVTRPATAAPTTLTETGQLVIGGIPANGNYDFQFSLWTAPAGGAQVGSAVTLLAVPVVGGVFYAEVNFGAAFASGATLYVQTAYRPAGAGTYTIQTPRHQAPNSAFADYASVSGTTLGLQSKGVSAAVPALGQALVYNGTLWAPAAVPAGPKGATGATGATGAKGATGLPGPTYTAGAGLGLSGGKFSILSGGVTAAMLGAGSVGAGAIAMPLTLTADSNGGASLLVNNVSGYGLYGSSAAPVFSGVYGVNNLSGDSGSLGGYVNGTIEPAGVIGSDSSNKGFSSYGVHGSSITGFGVYGSSLNSYGVGGDTGGSSSAGVVGTASTASSVGVYGQNTATGDLGVLASETTLGTATVGVGVYGTDPANGIGVLGTSNTGYAGYFSSGGANGLYGETFGTNGNGIVGVANNGSGAYGVYGSSTSGFAGVFAGKVSISGDLHVTGSITAGTKDFKIDDPLDPAGKYLSHACIESDQMQDLYNGHVVLDATGAALVALPDWFQALNKDFEYHLTPVGAPGPNLYVAAEIQNNQFRIAGGAPGLKVSWQVTGVRQDAYALAHPLQVEEDKPANEQGLFLHPAEQGQPKEQGIGYRQRLAHEAHATGRP